VPFVGATYAAASSTRCKPREQHSLDGHTDSVPQRCDGRRTLCYGFIVSDYFVRLLNELSWHHDRLGIVVIDLRASENGSKCVILDSIWNTRRIKQRPEHSKISLTLYGIYFLHTTHYLFNVGLTCKGGWRAPCASTVRDKRLCQVQTLVRRYWHPPLQGLVAVTRATATLPTNRPPTTANTARGIRGLSRI